MNERTFVLKGTICYSNSLTELSITENGYLVCEDGRCAGVFDELPEKFAGISCTDFGDELIIPGLTDLHLHAPQYTFRASGDLKATVTNGNFPVLAETASQIASCKKDCPGTSGSRNTWFFPHMQSCPCNLNLLIHSTVSGFSGCSVYMAISRT